MNGDSTPDGSRRGSAATISPFESIRYQVGLMNEAGKFLTAEPFGFKLNVSATAIKKRQIWTIEPDQEIADCICIKSHLGRYLSADKDGKVTAEGEEVTPECKFQVEFCKDPAKGGWAFRSTQYPYYLSGNEDQIRCFSKTSVWWKPHFAIHPQVHLRNLNRQRYVRLQDNELHGDQTIPWGYDSLITLEHINGRVAVRTRDKRYLSSEGTLVAEPTTEALYNLEMRGGANSGFAFQDSQGRYLTLIGANGTMKSKNKTISKDELFVLEVSYAQVALLAHNGKYASVKQGVDLYANQMDVDTTETFQLEFQSTGEWRIRTCGNKFLSIDPSTAGIKATGTEKDKSSLFTMEYQDDGSVAFKGTNQQYMTARKLGVVSAGSDAVGQEEKFYLILLNRPIMVFRSEFGLMGARATRVECNMVTYETFQLEHVGKAQYTLKDSKGAFWTVGDSGAIQLAREVTEPHTFSFQFQNRTQMAIRAANGKYLRGEQNGTVKADADDASASTSLWEY
jgi:fascin 1